ncbi:putative CCR4-associated factor 1-like protein 11 [Forsythia ovata]|uniref:poly(A)-specific ribonuclease n=1 Tax=Forsythia ovata TaxID=205694 RepID=A0ABD1TLM8_9LAMI
MARPIKVREVWQFNLEDEFLLIKKVLHSYPYASMDTEFPGVIYDHPQLHYSSLSPTESYSIMKKNVDAMELIQLGLALSDAEGNLPDFELPDDLSEFTGLVRMYFGVKEFDMKQMMGFCGLHGGLERMAKSLNVERMAGKSHQAGSDSLLTIQAFMELKKMMGGSTEVIP